MAKKELKQTDPDFLPTQYDLTGAKLKQLAKDYDPKNIPPAENKGDDGYQVVHEKAMAIVKVRTNIDKVRKNLNADAQTWIKKVNSEAKRLTTIVEDLEAPWKKVKTDLDEKEAREAEEARLKEKQRIDAIVSRIADINQLTHDLFGASAEQIKTRLIQAQEITIDELAYGEYVEAATHALNSVLDKLRTAFDERVLFEEQQAEMKRQQEAMLKQQQEIAEQQRLIDEENKRLANIAAAQQAEADRIERERLAEIERLADWSEKQADLANAEACKQVELAPAVEDITEQNAEVINLSGEPPAPTLTDELKAWSFHHEVSDQALQELAGILERNWPQPFELFLDDIA